MISRERSHMDIFRGTLKSALGLAVFLAALVACGIISPGVAFRCENRAAARGGTQQAFLGFPQASGQQPGAAPSGPGLSAGLGSACPLQRQSTAGRGQALGRP